MTSHAAAPTPAPELPRGPAAAVRASPRERLLDAAADLCYRRGVGVPVNDLCKAAGISKRSMYKLFESKEALLAAALEHRAPEDGERLPGRGCRLDPRAGILYVFERLEDLAGSPDYMGCCYTTALVELKDPAHPASAVAARAQQELMDFFRAEAARAGAADPDLLARQLAVVYDGASTRAGIGADDLRGLAVATAATLIDAAVVLA